MKTFPLQSLTIIEAQQKQFALVDSICRHFPGSEFLTGGDLGLTPGLNQPRVTQRVEQVLADAFHAQAAALVQGAGTGAIRAGLAALLKPGQRLLVHDAPVYPTTRVIIEQMGLTLITVDFNDLSALKQVVDEQQPDAALVQHTRQQPQDSYVLADVLATLRAAGVPALTDDNYAVMKVARIGCECGANVSTFSCFKLFGPEGVGAVVGDADVINRIRATLYSGGSQIDLFYPENRAAQRMVTLSSYRYPRRPGDKQPDGVWSWRYLGRVDPYLPVASKPAADRAAGGCIR